jgi:hypothetical protein
MPRSHSKTCALLPLLGLIALGAAGCATAGGAQAPGTPAATPTAAPGTPAGDAAARPDAFNRIVGSARHLSGFLDVYRTADDKLYLAVPAARLGTDFLMEYKIARGVGAGGMYGGTMISGGEADIVRLERHGESLFLTKQPTRFRAEAGTPQAAAVALSFTPSVLESARIEATRDGVHLIDVTNWFVGDVSGISSRVRGLAPGNTQFDRGRSYVEEVKAFPKNVNIRTMLTFRPQTPVGNTAVADGRYVSVAVHHTLAELPERPMQPRLGDDRMGFFLIVHKDFTDTDRDDFFVRHVKRWRLEPGAPAGNGLVYPVQPIVYYLDRTIPEEFLPYFKEGVEAWNPAFEAAGFRNAIRAEMLPEGADADDIRYPTLRWNTSDQAGYSAIGPSLADPRTGEILDANQLYEANMILGFRRSWQNLVDAPRAVDLALGVIDGDAEAGLEALQNHTHMAGIMSDQGTFLRALLAARGDIAPDEPLPQEFVAEAVRWVVMHEVGHTLGLRHNFRSSSDTPLDRLHDREWSETRGLVSSVMDYHAPNVAPAGQPQGYFYSPAVGSADRWKIAFGYTADPARALELARLGETEGRTYGSDEDNAGTGAMDPSVNTYDLSADPLAWGQQRTALIAELWADLPRAVLTDNARYADLTSAFQSLLGQYGQALAPAVKYVGGEYVYRTRPGDPGDRGPFVPVERAKQVEALRFLTERAFSERAFTLPAEMMAQFGPQRWNHWGQQNTYNGRIDFPFHEQITGVQTRYLAQLLNPFRLSRMRDAEMRHGAGRVLTIPQLMDELTGAIWSEVTAGRAASIPSLRRELQRDHLDRLRELVVAPPDRLPGDARSIARAQLRQLDGRIATALQQRGGAMDAYTRAHLAESRDRIAQALEASVQLPAGR